MENENVIYFGGSVKALGNGAIKGYLVRWGSPEELDLEGDFFTKDTYLGAHDGDGVDVTVQHGMPLRWFDNPEQMAMAEKYAAQLLHPIKTERDDVGLLAETILDLNDNYQAMLYEMVEQGRLSWSSGSAPHLVVRSALPGGASRVDRWVIAEAALTPTPAEPRLGAVQPMKSLNAAEIQPDDAPDSGDAGVLEVETRADVDEVEVKEDTTEVVKMVEEQTTPAPVPVIDYEKLAAAIAAATPPPVAKSAGVVVQDEIEAKAENPEIKGYANFGEQLLDVRNALGGRPSVRLLKAHKMAAKASGLSESVPADGGFLVQTEFVNELLIPEHGTGQVLSLIPSNRRMQITNGANSVSINGIDETSRVNGSRYGGVTGYWLAEAAEKTASKPKFRNINLRVNKVIVLAYATDELLADASMLGTVIGNTARDELAFKVDDAIIEGTGAGMPMGIIGSPGLVTQAKETGQTADTVVAQNIIKMWSRRWVSATNYVWFVNQDVTPQLHALNLPVGTGGALVYMPPGGLSGSAYGTLYNAPVIEIEQASTLGDKGDVILASMEKYLFIDKGAAQEASSIHVRFVYDETAFRFVYRCDGQPLNSSALTPFKGNKTVSPFVTLAART
jgi:HK97 family phage major capsid protein